VFCGCCGASIRAGARFCTQCGTPVVFACQQCGGPVLVGDRFCASCGVPCVAGAVRGQPVRGQPGIGYQFTSPPVTQAWPAQPAYAAPVQAPPQQTQPAPQWSPPVTTVQAPPWVQTGPEGPPQPAAAQPLVEAEPEAKREPATVEPAPDENAARTAALHSRISAGARERAAESLAASEGERRLATILYADVFGFTKLSGTMDHEDVGRVMERIFDVVKEVADSYDGWLVKTVGDAVLVTFGAPLAVEEPHERAIRAALELGKRIAELDLSDVDTGGVRPQLRIGINTGEVMAGGIMADGTPRFDVMGTAVNISQRLEGAAPVGGILVSQEVRDRAGESFEFESVGALELKNVAEPVQAYVVRGVKKRESRLERSARLGLSRMIGRRGHQKSFLNALQVASEGRGQVVAIAGEAGVGKSRLIHEVLAKARDQGGRVLEGYCLSFGLNVAYLPLAEVTRAACGIDDLEPEPTQRAKLTRTLESLGDGLADRAPAIGWIMGLTVPGSSIREMPAEARVPAVRAAFLDMVRALAAERLLVIVFDDVQWLDPSSEDVLQALVHEAAGRSLLLVFAHRLDFSPFWDAADNVTGLELSRLTPDESAELLSDRLGGYVLPPAIRDGIIERAAGVPFFLEEIVRNLVTSGQLDGNVNDISLSEVPATVYDLLMARLDVLAQESMDWRTLLQIASVVRPPVRREILEAVAGPRSDVKAGLSALVRYRFLRQRGEAEDEYDFEHHLALEVAYKSISRRRRNQMHRRVAEAMELLYATRLQAQAHVISYHYEQGGLPKRALQYLGLAVEQDLKRGTLAELDERVARAFELLKPLGSDPAYVALTGKFHVDRAAARARLRRAHLAIEDAKRAVELALAAGAPDVEAEAYDKLAFAYTMMGDYPRAESYYELALRVFALFGPTSLELPVRQGAAAVLHQRGEFGKALEMYEQVLREERRQAQKTGKFRGVMSVLNNIGSCLMLLDQYDEALEYFRQFDEVYAQDAANEPDGKSKADPVLVATARTNAAMVHLALGRHHKALEGFQNVLETFRDFQHPMEAYVLKDIASVRAELAQYDYALASARDAMTVATESSMQDAAAEAMLVEATVHNRLGSAEQAEELVQKALEIARRLENPLILTRCYCTRAYARLKQGDAAGTIEAAQLGLDVAREGRAKKAQAEALVALGHGRLLVDEAELAERTFDEARSLADEIRARLSLAEAHLGLGRTRMALGDASRASQSLRAAVDLASEIDRPETLWRAYAGLARLRRSAGEAQDALKSYFKAIEALKRIVGNVSAGTGKGSPADSLLELQAEATVTLVELGASAKAASAEKLVSLLRSSPGPDALREHSPEIEKLLDKLARQSGIDLTDTLRN